MFDPEEPEFQSAHESDESFKDILSQFEQSKSRKAGETGQGREGTVITVTFDSVLVDIGFKTEGILPLATFQNAGETVQPGDKLLVSVKGRDPEGYYELTRCKVERPKDWGGAGEGVRR
jgi:small subunit ribosomal protein S1